MAKKKVSGKVKSSKSAYYCGICPTTARKITYGPNGRTVNSRSAELAKKKRRCITYSNGKSLKLDCNTCKYNCAGTNTSCPTNNNNDDTIAVYVL